MTVKSGNLQCVIRHDVVLMFNPTDSPEFVEGTGESRVPAVQGLTEPADSTTLPSASSFRSCYLVPDACFHNHRHSVRLHRIVKSGPSPQRFQPAEKDPQLPWELVVSGDLTDKGGELMEKLVEVPFGSSGLIFFDSGGGSAYSGLALAAVIRLRGLQATGVVAGECSSAALIPFAACTQRVVTPHATLLFHPVRWQSDEDMQLEEAAEWARHFQILEHSMDNLLSRLFDVPLERITSWTRPGRFVTGPEFAATGLAQVVDLFSGDLRTQLKALALQTPAPQPPLQA